MSQAYTPYSALIAELQQWCRERRTGIVYVTTDMNHPAQINLEKGEIVFLVFQGKLGASALPLMQHINACRFRFAEGSIPAVFRTPLPPTGEVLGLLAAGVKQATPVPWQTETASVGAEITEQAKTILEQALAEYIGPMVAIVCAEHFEKAHDLKSAVEALASEIPKPEHAIRFKEDVARKLKIH